MNFSEPEMQRYSRQIIVDDFGGRGQTRLKMARIFCVLEPGNLSQRVALAYSCASGIGSIALQNAASAFITTIEAQQGFAFCSGDAGEDRAQVLADYLHSLNPEITINIATTKNDSDILLPALLGSPSLAKALEIGSGCAAHLVHQISQGDL